MLVAAVAGCGASSGVAAGARVTVYLAAPLHGSESAAGHRACASARMELAHHHGGAGDVRVRLVCLDDSGAGGSRLAAIGADARRATEDSSTVAYLLVADPLAIRFSRTIVEAAGIAPVTAGSGATAMRRVLHAVGESGSSSLRDSVREALE